MTEGRTNLDICSTLQENPNETNRLAVSDNPAGIEIELLGAGAQRRYRIGDVAYDRANNLLHVLELFAEQAKPIAHVWGVR